MGSKQRTRQNQTVNQTMNEQVTGIDPYQRQFAQGYGELSNLFRNRIAQPVNLEYAQPFSSTPDTLVQNMVSQGVQGLRNADAARSAELANRLSVAGTGNNSALMAALNSAAQIRNAGAANALVPAALEQQRQFDLARQNIINQQNQTRLAARNQSINELQPGLNLLQTLNQMAQLSAGRRATSTGTTSSTGFQSRSFF